MEVGAGRGDATDAASARHVPAQPQPAWVPSVQAPPCRFGLSPTPQRALSAASWVQNLGKAAAASWLAHSWRQWSQVSMSGMAAAGARGSER